MEECSWRFQSCLLSALTICCLFLLNLGFCCSINDEGLALLRFKEKIASDPFGALTNWEDEDGLKNPCSWVGVGCSEGHVVALNLQDLCLMGTLAADLGNLVRVKSIIMRNNSIFGIIPEEILSLRELEILDLGYNNFSGPLPCHLGSKILIGIIFINNNEFLCGAHPVTLKVRKLSEVQAEDERVSTAGTLSCNGLLITCHDSCDNYKNSRAVRSVAGRKLLQSPPVKKNSSKSPSHATPPPDVMNQAPKPPVDYPPPDSELQPNSVPPPPPELVPPPLLPLPDAPVSPSPSSTPRKRANSQSEKLVKVIAVVGGVLLLLSTCGLLLFYRRRKAAVKPPASGFSGDLQTALLTGVRIFERSELVAACEDFSNVIVSSSIILLYKGTLSTGDEIVVASNGLAPEKWPKDMEAHFEKKIAALSKVKHKNFVCLIGYCVEEEPLTRMMVFEYAPNGTLFEHLHVREAEHLDWAARLRIAMGIAYCLEHMHQLAPPIAHRNLTSSSIYLTEDYAAKVSDFIYDNAADMKPSMLSDVYSFGVILFEMITGRFPNSLGGELPETLASDPTLGMYNEHQLQLIGMLSKECTNPNPRRRPSMRQVCDKLWEITGIEPDGAAPKSSPLWWAEQEIQS